LTDKEFVSRFLKDAVEIFETAAAAPGADASPELSILYDAGGQLRIVQTEGWSPDGLRQHYGAQTSYHVSRTASGIVVDARGPGGSCRLQSEKPQVPSLHLTAGVPQYTIIRALADY